MCTANYVLDQPNAFEWFKTYAHCTTESKTLQEYVTPVIDNERGYLELSLLYM